MFLWAQQQSRRRWPKPRQLHVELALALRLVKYHSHQLQIFHLEYSAAGSDLQFAQQFSSLRQ